VLFDTGPKHWLGGGQYASVFAYPLKFVHLEISLL
jgi:hypothetical protein